jgi:hypothetical protein
VIVGCGPPFLEVRSNRFIAKALRAIADAMRGKGIGSATRAWRAFYWASGEAVLETGKFMVTLPLLYTLFSSLVGSSFFRLSDLVDNYIIDRSIAVMARKCNRVRTFESWR